LFTFAAAALAGGKGKVIAVEPDVWLVSLLRRSASMQPGDHAPVTILPAAITDQVGITTLHVVARSRSSNFVSGGGSPNRGSPVRSTETTMAVTLDWLAQYLPSPDVLKIDVGGLEAKVLQGGHAVLAKRPKILCEVYSEHQREVAAMLGAYGYRFHDYDDPQFRAVELPPYSMLALT
jgi:FkbM family methyltransferase